MPNQVGEKPGKGNYCCTGCNWSVTLDDVDDQLPPCENCGAGNTTYELYFDSDDIRRSEI